jgi:hypothetical protein
MELAERTETAVTFPPLDKETRPAVDTAAAAYYLNRRPQTLRIWAMRDGSGPIRPRRVNGRLAWPVCDLKRVLGVA